MQRRSEDIKKGYHVQFTDDSLLLIGEQMDCEMQNDFVAMLFAIERMGKFLLFSREDKNRRPYDSQIEMAYKDLLNRVSKYSCPNMLKNHANCPLTNDGCFMNGCFKMQKAANGA